MCAIAWLSIFTIVLLIASLIFPNDYSHLHFLFFADSCRCHFFDLSDFLCTHFRFCCLNKPFITFTLLLTSCFTLFQLFLMFVLTRFVLAVFAVQISLLHQFALARFRFSWHLYLFLPPPYLCTSVPHHKSLAYPTFLHMIPSDQHDIIAHLLFFALCACVTKYFLITHLGIFLPCFYFPPYPCINAHAWESIYTHLNSSASLFDKLTKTWCSGKFTRP